MNTSNVYILEKIIREKSIDLDFTSIKTRPQNADSSVVSILREDWHLWTELRIPIAPPMPFQMSIRTEDSKIGMLFFPSPGIIKKDNVGAFIQLANVANHYLYRGTALGRFWVDEDNLDFSYEVRLKEKMLECCAEEVAEQLFDIPWSHFKDLQTPLSMLARDIWKEDMAVRFLTELREDGYIYNDDYGLW